MSENLKNTIDKKKSHRVIAYVDGYNLYCAVNKWRKSEKKPDLVKYHLWDLVRECLGKIKNSKSKNLEGIKFFTAPPREGKGEYNLDHYKQWIKWQEKKRGVEVIQGFHSLQNKEKQSDVNLAVEMLSGAFKNPYNHFETPYDTAVLISNDRDYCRLILKCLQLKKYVSVLSTTSKNSIENELREEKLYSSDCQPYIRNGTLNFYQITKEDIKSCPDSEYIYETKNDD